MKLSYLHFADYAFLTDLGKISMIGIFERIQAKSFPTTHGSMFVVGQVGDIAKEKELSLKISKGHQVFLENQFVTNLPDVVNPLRTYNFVIGLHNFVFPEAGVYDFTIATDGREIDTKKLVIEKPFEG